MNTKALVQATALLITVVFAVPSSAETVDPSPLRPADTSSPRATLRSLIEYVDEGYRGAADLYKSYDNSGRGSVRGIDDLPPANHRLMEQ